MRMSFPNLVSQPSLLPPQEEPEVLRLFANIVDKGRKFNIDEVLKDHQVLLIGLPGAFTPVDTNVFMPQLVECLPEFDKIFDFIFCIVVNDPYVVKAWRKMMRIPSRVKFISDWRGELTHALGKGINANEFYLGHRSKRFSSIYKNRELLWEGEAGEAFPLNVRNVALRLNMSRVSPKGITGIINNSESPNSGGRSHCDDSPRFQYCPINIDDQILEKEDYLESAIDERLDSLISTGNN